MYINLHTHRLRKTKNLQIQINFESIQYDKPGDMQNSI